jgi:3-oxoacyl-[acyl-carrier protein] reductase
MPGVEGRVALVTGGAQGIGAAVARRLSQGGASVAVLDLQQEAGRRDGRAAHERGGSALGIGGDVSRRQDVQAAVDQVVDRFGALHILVNNAGVIRDNLLFKMSDDDWTTVLDVHLRGAFLASQLAQKHMVEARYGASSRCRRRLLSATVAKSTIRRPKRDCRVSRRHWRSSSGRSG